MTLARILPLGLLLACAPAVPDARPAPLEPQRPAVPERSTPSPLPAAPPTVETPCREQAPQPFLIRSSYAFKADAPLDERQRLRAIHQRSIEYRTRAYGHVEGFGDPRWNALEPKHYAVVRTFFGIPVRMNIRVLTALQCVEQAIVASCADAPYQPTVLHGIRFENTFYDSEVSNHLYGIAIDIDPDENPCCNCIGRARNVPRCKEPAASPFERTRIPRCWIDTFERYGFYWLGRDELEDTMHFEFLGDPDQILTDAAPHPP